MLIKSISVGDLLPGDILRDDFTVADDEAIASNTLDIIRQAVATPTRTSPKEEHYNRARKVERAPKVKRVYTYLTMGTYAVLGQRNGTLVSVYRNGGNEPEDVSPAVVEVPPLDTVPAGTEEVPYRPERQPFNYARSQFRQLGDYRAKGIYASKLKVVSDGGETRWMNIHPEDLATLQRLMEAREDKEG